MAKFRTATIAAALLCFFTVSLARTAPSHEDAAVTTQVDLPLSSDDQALRLPTETDAKINAETDPNSGVPLAEITFRPVNRRFHVRSKRPCRHHHHFKFYPSTRENEEISYGNDMILSSGENSDFEQPIVRGGGRRIPGRWMRMQRQHRLRAQRDEDSDIDSDGEEEEDRAKKVVFRRYDNERFNRQKNLMKLRNHFRVRNDEAEKKKNKAGFMIRMRKFLDHYI